MADANDIKLDEAPQFYNNIPQLQNLMRRDPASYKEEYASSLGHFDALIRLVSLTPADASIEFNELVTFLCHVSYCYAKESLELPGQLLALLKRCFPILHPTTRFSLVTNLILLKHRSQIHDLPELYSVFFELLSCHDKSLRNTVYGFLLSDIKAMNMPNRNEKLNRALQAFLVRYWDISAPASGKCAANELMAKLCLRLTIELYCNGVWLDARTVNYIALAALSLYPSVCRAALEFFAGGRSHQHNDDDDDDDDPETGDADASVSAAGAAKPSLKDGSTTAKASEKPASSDIASAAIDKLKHSMRISGTTKGTLKRIKRAAASAKRIERKATGISGANRKIAPLLSLHDPQGFSEKLFSKLKTSSESFELRLCFMNVISRLISYHSLTLLPFYSYLTKYLRPTQPSVTKLLLYAAQSVHENVPVDVIQETLLAPLLQYFIADYCTPEVITVGINALREMCKRNLHLLAPQLSEEPDTEAAVAATDGTPYGRKKRAQGGSSASSCSSTIAYLIAFKSYKNKGVVMAARSLLALYREKMPSYLPKRERGKAASVKLQNKAAKTKSVAALSVKDQSSDDACSVASSQDDDLSDSEMLLCASDQESELETDNRMSEDETSGDDSESKGTKEPDAVSLDGTLAQQSTLVEPGFVAMNSIISYSKQKSTYEERLASIKAGREDREKYKRQSKKLASGGSRSNMEKNKDKNFMMKKHKRSGIFSRSKKRMFARVARKAQKGKVRK